MIAKQHEVQLHWLGRDRSFSCVTPIARMNFVTVVVIRRIPSVIAHNAISIAPFAD